MSFSGTNAVNPKAYPLGNIVTLCNFIAPSTNNDIKVCPAS